MEVRVHVEDPGVSFGGLWARGGSDTPASARACEEPGTNSDNPGLPSASCSHSAQEKLGPLVPLTWRAFLLVARLIREGSPSPPLAGITAVSLCSVVMKNPHDHTGTGAFGGKRIEGPPRLYSR